VDDCKVVETSVENTDCSLSIPNVVFSVEQTDESLFPHLISTSFQTSSFDTLPSRLSSFQSFILQSPFNMSSPAKGQGSGESYSWRVTKEKNLLNVAQIERLAGLALLCLNTMNVSVS